MVQLVRQTRNLRLCNRLDFSFSVLPYYSFLDGLNFSALIQLNSTALVNSQYSYNKDNLSLSYDFTEDMGFKKLSVIQNTTLMLSYPSYTFLFYPSSFEIVPDNNVPANFMDEASCAEKEAFQVAYKVMETASFVLLIISMVPGKIIGL